MSKERTKLRKKLDRVFSLYIRERDDYVCVVCGKTKPEVVIQCGHLFSRASYSTRWDESNAYAQCASCNYRHEFDFEPFRRAWVYLNGQAAYDALYEVHRKSRKFTASDFEEMIEEFQRKTKEIQERRENEPVNI